MEPTSQLLGYGTISYVEGLHAAPNVLPVSWSLQDDSIGGNDIVTNFNSFYVMAGFQYIFYSTDDGVNWSIYDAGGPPDYCQEITIATYSIDRDEFVCFDYSRGNTYTSPNASDWTKHTSTGLPSSTDVIQAALWSRDAEVYLAAGTDKKIYTSADATSWSDAFDFSAVGTSDSSVPFRNSFVFNFDITCLIVRGAVCYSTDAVTWSSADFTSTTGRGISTMRPTAACWDGTKFVALGRYTNDGKMLCLTSTDGMAWEDHSETTGITLVSEEIQSVFFDGDLYWANTATNSVWFTSSDGITWSAGSGDMTAVLCVYPQPALMELIGAPTFAFDNPSAVGVNSIPIV